MTTRPLVPEEGSRRRRRQLFKEVAASFGTRKGHEHLFETASGWRASSGSPASQPFPAASPRSWTSIL